MSRSIGANPDGVTLRARACKPGLKTSAVGFTAAPGSSSPDVAFVEARIRSAK